MIIPLRFRCYDRRLSPRHLIKWIDILEICPFVNLDNKSLNHGREEGKEEERRKKEERKEMKKIFRSLFFFTSSIFIEEQEEEEFFYMTWSCIMTTTI